MKKTFFNGLELQRWLRAEIQEAVNGAFEHLELSSIREEQKEPQLMSVQEVADWFQVSKQTVFAWRNRSILKCRRVGGRIFFKREDVLSAGKVIQLKSRRL